MASSNNTDNKTSVLISMYESAINLSNHEGDLVWSRFNAFMLANSIFIAFVSNTLITNLKYHLYIIYLSLIGLVICLL